MRKVYIGGDTKWGRRRCSYCGLIAFLCIRCIEVASDQIDLVEEVLGELDRRQDIILVTTDQGVSSLVGVEAKRRGFQVEIIKSNLNYYGSRGDAIRDHILLSLPPEKVIILHDHLDEDRNLKRFVRWSQKEGIPTVIRGLPATSIAAPPPPSPPQPQQESL